MAATKRSQKKAAKKKVATKTAARRASKRAKKVKRKPLATPMARKRVLPPRDIVDESSDESFPASDPPSWTPVTGEDR